MTEADYCICTLPLPILGGSRAISRREENGDRGRARLSAQRQAGVRSAGFWETDDSIFGGLAWTDRAQ